MRTENEINDMMKYLRRRIKFHKEALKNQEYNKDTVDWNISRDKSHLQLLEWVLKS